MSAPATLNSQPGTYALILSSPRDGSIRIGRLGELALRPGFCVYVGSAFGPGGLRARIVRHWRRVKPLRWHVDYLRAAAELIEVWFTTDRARRECDWAEAFRHMPGAEVPLPRFGSSDCTCRSHLFYFAKKPSRSAFRRRLGMPLKVCHGTVAGRAGES